MVRRCNQIEPLYRMFWLFLLRSSLLNEYRNSIEALARDYNMAEEFFRAI